MRNENSGVKRYYPTDSGTGGRFDGQDKHTDDARESESPPREDAAETTRDRSGAGPRPSGRTDPDADNSVASRSAGQSVILPDGGQLIGEDTGDGDNLLEEALNLTSFQISQLAAALGTAKSGQGILEILTDLPFEGEITSGRLYPNLDALVEADLLEKTERDRRTHEYPVTKRGQHLLSAYEEWLTDATDAFEGPVVDVVGFHRAQAVQLSTFQVGCLTALSDDYVSGQTIKDCLEEAYGCEINHGRLYPNLDTLVTNDLVAKDAIDRRTNGNELTPDGRAVLVARRDWLREQGLATNGGDR